MKSSKPVEIPPTQALAAQPKDHSLDSASGGEATQGEQTIASSSSLSDDLSGTTLGVYEVIGKLGQGGMGAVYKIRHTKLDKLMALKVLPAHLLREPDALARFEREMRAVGKLQHPNLVQAHDAGEINGLHYLTLELMEGGDLTQLVKARGPLPVRTACRVIRQAALALDYAHRQELVHRDIKPSNLMLTGNGQLKVSDLGLARLGQDETALEALTRTGSVMGTPDFMAPEQWEDTHAVDGRADLYALGCTLYFLLHGHAPWQTPEHGTMASKLKAHVMKEPPDLRGGRSDVPEALCAIYHNLLSKSAEDRFATGAELAQALAPLTVKPDGSAVTGAVSAASTSQHEKTVTLAPSASPLVPASQPKQDTAPDVALLAALPAPAPISVTRGGARGKTKAHRMAGADRGKRPFWLVAVGGGGLAALLLFGGIIIKITNKDGTTTEIRVPEGARVEVIRPDAEPENKPGMAAGVASQDWPADAPAAIAPFDAAQATRHQEAWAAYLKVPVEREIELPGGVKLAMMLIPPGEFLMGSPEEVRERVLEEAKAANDNWAVDRIPTEGPQNLIRITKPFYLGKYEVTQAQWEAVMENNPSRFSKTGTDPNEASRVADMDTSNHPVENVSWYDAAEFCAKLSQLQGLKPLYLRSGDTVTFLKGTGYRLPTEAEWEYACRAGTTTAYWNGDREGDLLRTDWINRNSGNRTHAVGELLGNPFGLFDVHGNIHEWCQDWWDPAYYQWLPTTNPEGPPSSSYRLYRGGSWLNPGIEGLARGSRGVAPGRIENQIAICLVAIQQRLRVMPFKFFTIPIRDGGDAEGELNRFLQSHKALTVDRRWVEQGADSFWSICVDYLTGSVAGPPASAPARRGKVDYKEVLSPQEFAIFAKLRELRKELAQEDSVPVYTIFTDEQLAQMAQGNVTDKASLEKVDGVGTARVEKYGARVLELLSRPQTTEDGGNGAV